MDPCKLKDNNKVFGVDQAGVRPVRATVWQDNEGRSTISVGWVPSEDELRRLNEGWPVIVDVRGTGMPPMRVRVAGDG